MNGGPPLVMDVTLVEDIGRAADDADRAADARVVDVGVADVEDARQIVMGMTTWTFMPRMRPLDLAQSHSFPNGMGVESISLTKSRPSLRH